MRMIQRQSRAHTWVVLASVAAVAAIAFVGAVDTTLAAATNEIDAELEASYNRLMGDLMSPYCPGRTIKNCPSYQATLLRERIRESLESGQTEEAVLAALLDEFGDGMLGRPRFSGFGLVAWLTPLVVLVGGGWGVTAFPRRQSSRAAAAPETEFTPPDEEGQRLEAILETELAALDPKLGILNP